MNSLWQFFVLISITILAVSCQENQQACSQDNLNEKQIYETAVRAELKVKEMERKLEAALDTVLSVLYYRKEEMDSKFEQLSKSISENLTDSFTSKVNDKVSLLSDLIERLGNKSATLDEYIREHIDFPAKLRDLKLYIDSLRPTTIAFSATTPAATSVDTNQVIVMTDVQLNEGAGYNESTGEFTAPENGHYLFHAQLCGPYRKWILISIVVNKNVVAKGGHFDEYSNSCTSLSAIVWVKKGQKVLFRATYPTTLFTDSYRQCSVFGYRLGN